MKPQFVFATSTVTDGNMDLRFGEHDEVIRNRSNFLKKLGLGDTHCLIMDSPHKDLVTVIYESENDSRGIATIVIADALITQQPNTALMLTTADCLPIGLFDAATQTVALVHVSRHTFCNGLLEKTFATLEELKVDTHNLTLSIGPHIHKNSYCFPLPLAETPEKLVPYMETTAKAVCIDLASAALTTLIGLGVPNSNISISASDTVSDQNYFSHVRAVQSGTLEGRMLSVACITI